MKRYKGFTFVELMLVLLVLGIIIMLTLPLLKNLKDDSKIYRAYMKKANQDVTDAVSMALIKNRAFTGFNALRPLADLPAGMAGYTNDADGAGIRTALSVAVAGRDCEGTGCLTNNPPVADAKGLILPGKSVMMFEYNKVDEQKDAAGNVTQEATYGHIYIDMNGDKSPNEDCKDRYTFVLYNDRAVMVGECADLVLKEDL